MSDDIDTWEQAFQNRKYIWRDVTQQEFVHVCLFERGYERVTIDAAEPQ